MVPIDFSKYTRTNHIFTGTEKKISVMVDGTEYLIKFQKEDGFRLRNNHISEHIGSTIFSLLGIDAQKTLLGTYGGENVVACKLFTSDTVQFVPFNDVGESTIDQGLNSQYTYEEIMAMLRANKKLTSVESTIDSFWDVYIVDSLLGNFDRHGANWGFLKENNTYRMAPIFDNGSCLFPKMTDESEMIEIISSKEKTDERIYTFPTSQILLDGKKSSYYEIISSLQFKECNDALLRIYPRINMKKIERFINGIEEISDIQKEFYLHMIRSRKKTILSESYERLMEL